jgi:DHA1 family tetracycline resistance protein-like MFS transporter
VTRALRVFVSFSVFLEAMGGGLIGPVLPTLMTKFTLHGWSSVSLILGWSTMISATAMFVSAPMMGRLSDRFGRRPIVLLSIFWAAADYVISATTRSLVVFLVTRAIAGACAGGAVAVQAVIADVTPAEKRARNFAMLGAGFGIGMILGPPLGGFLGRAGPEGPFWAAAALFGIDFVLGLLVLKETLPRSARSTFAFKDLDPVRALLRIGRFRLGVTLAVFVAVQFAGTAENSVMVLFTQVKFGWSSSQIGLFYSMVGLSLFVSKLAVTPAILASMGERRTILLGVLLHVSCSLVYACVPHGWQMYIGLSIWLVAGMALPTLSGVMSSMVSAREQGEYLGSVMSLQVVIGGVAALAGTTIFSYSTGSSAPFVLPGATFLASSFIYAAALIMALRSRPGALAPTFTVESEALTRGTDTSEHCGKVVKWNSQARGPGLD